MNGQRHRKPTRLSTYDYNTPGAYFITICTKDRKPVLSRIMGPCAPYGPSIELLPYGRIAAKHLHQICNYYHHLSVDSYVIMPDHIHILLSVKDQGPNTPITTPQNSAVARFISTFKRFCNKEYGKDLWQPRSYDHVIRDQKDYDRHLKYIYENPFAWVKDGSEPQIIV